MHAKALQAAQDALIAALRGQTGQTERDMSAPRLQAERTSVPRQSQLACAPKDLRSTPRQSAGPSFDPVETYLQPTNNPTGFFVRIRDSSFLVRWSDLLSLLMAPEATSTLPRNHPVRQVAKQVTEMENQAQSSPSAEQSMPTVSPRRVNPSRNASSWDFPTDSDSRRPSNDHTVQGDWNSDSFVQPTVSYGRMREEFFPPFSAFTQEALRNDTHLQQRQQEHGVVSPRQLHDTQHYAQLQYAYVPAQSHQGAAHNFENARTSNGYTWHPVEPRYSMPGAPLIYQVPRWPTPPVSHIRQASSETHHQLPVVHGPARVSTNGHSQHMRQDSNRSSSASSTRSSASSTRRNARQMTRPYPADPARARKTKSASRDIAVAHEQSSDTTRSAQPIERSSTKRIGTSSKQPMVTTPTEKTPTHRRRPVLPLMPPNNRPLNTGDEHYAWQRENARLLKIPPGTDPEQAVQGDTVFKGCELLTFPAGSYYTITVRDHTVCPADAQHLNDLLRAQGCVEGCRFRTEKKRPATVRNHFINCKLRMQEMPIDPLRRLCELINEKAKQSGNPGVPASRATYDRVKGARRTRSTYTSDEEEDEMDAGSGSSESASRQAYMHSGYPYEGFAQDWSDGSSWSGENDDHYSGTESPQTVNNDLYPDYEHAGEPQLASTSHGSISNSRQNWLGAYGYNGGERPMSSSSYASASSSYHSTASPSSMPLVVEPIPRRLSFLREMNDDDEEHHSSS